MASFVIGKVKKMVNSNFVDKDQHEIQNYFVDVEIEVLHAAIF